MTKAESALWKALRKRQCAGVKFLRQIVFGKFITDFCAFEPRLIIEIDGSIHESQKEYDAERQKILEERGFTVIRFANEQVLNDLAGTLQTIAQVIGSIYAANKTITGEKKHLQNIPSSRKGRPGGA